MQLHSRERSGKAEKEVGLPDFKVQLVDVEVGVGGVDDCFVKNQGFVGAGSTITTDVAEDELAITRTKQKSIKGWKRPVKDK